MALYKVSDKYLGCILYVRKSFGKALFGLSRSHFIEAYRKCITSIIGTEYFESEHLCSD